MCKLLPTLLLTAASLFPLTGFADDPRASVLRHQSQDTSTVSQIAKAVVQAEGAIRLSDVCLSPRWPKERPGGMPLEVAKQFHATRMDWVYLSPESTDFCEQARAAGILVSGTVNATLPDKPTGKQTFEIGRARDLDGKPVIQAFMKAWRCYAGCANNPDYQRIWLDHAKVQIDVGAHGIQMDDPHLSDEEMMSYGGCYCEHCMKGFRQSLQKQLNPDQLQAIGIDDIETFDYSNMLREARSSGANKKANEGPLHDHYKHFLNESVLRFFKKVHAELNTYAGRNVPFSCNTPDGVLSYLYQAHDSAMLETYPEKEGVPEAFYREMILPCRERGKSLLTTLITTDLALTRRYIAQNYAFGQHAIVPWDVYTGPQSPRIFGLPADSADLYGFVRANAKWIDGYQEAAVTGRGIEDDRYESDPPVHVRGGSRQVISVVRARPGQPDAAVVVHLVDWAENPEPFSVVLDPRRLFGNRPFRVRLLTPAPYSDSDHQNAQESGQFGDLSTEQVLSEGRQTNIDLPALAPWGMLVIEPIKETGAAAWQPMAWADPESYYEPQLSLHCVAPFSDAPLHYSLDGSEPTANSPQYNGPILLDHNKLDQNKAMLRVQAISTGGRSSHQPGPETAVTISKTINKDGERRRDARKKTMESLRLWLSAETLASSLSDGDPVTQWKAKVGPTAEVSSVKLPNQDQPSAPRFRSHGINGRPGVEFHEPSSHLDVPGFMNKCIAGKPFTIFMVSRSKDPQFGFSGNGRNGNGGVPRLYSMRVGVVYDANTLVRAAGRGSGGHINTFQLDETTLRSWVNGKLKAERSVKAPVKSFGGGGSLAMPFWSENRPHLGEIAEILIYDRSLNLVEREAIEDYLAIRYGIRKRSRWALTTGPPQLTIALDRYCS